MNRKDYFALGVIYRKIILLSLAYLIFLYIPFFFLIKNTLDNQLLFKSLEVQDAYVKCRNLSFSLESNQSLKLVNKEFYFEKVLSNRFNETASHFNHLGDSHPKPHSEDIEEYKGEDFLIKSEEILGDKIKENKVTNNAEDNSVPLIKGYIDNLLHFQFLYFFVLLIRIFNKPIQ
jgi:hypothetical protein